MCKKETLPVLLEARLDHLNTVKFFGTFWSPECLLKPGMPLIERRPFSIKFRKVALYHRITVFDRKYITNIKQGRNVKGSRTRKSSRINHEKKAATSDEWWSIGVSTFHDEIIWFALRVWFAFELSKIKSLSNATLLSQSLHYCPNQSITFSQNAFHYQPFSYGFPLRWSALHHSYSPIVHLYRPVHHLIKPDYQLVGITSQH